MNKWVRLLEIPEQYKLDRRYVVEPRMYIPEGKKFPMLHLHIGQYLFDLHRTIRVHVSRKDNPSDMWSEDGLPVELMGELEEMLKEYTKAIEVEV